MKSCSHQKKRHTKGRSTAAVAARSLAKVEPVFALAAVVFALLVAVALLTRRVFHLTHQVGEMRKTVGETKSGVLLNTERINLLKSEESEEEGSSGPDHIPAA